MLQENVHISNIFHAAEVVSGRGFQIYWGAIAPSAPMVPTPMLIVHQDLAANLSLL